MIVIRHIVRLLIIFFSLSSLDAQVFSVTEQFALPNELSESSGAIFYNNKLITHNDSGNNNVLYELDLETELVTRVITIIGATNVDWEDMAQDDSSIYIGDFGNNSGDRTDLKVYKISKSDYQSSNVVTAEIISFTYANQIDFTSNPQNTTWDAEALVSWDASSLVLLSKNWVSGTTSAYVLPKTPGIYVISPLETELNANGLITGATYDDNTNQLLLVGYSNPTLQPFVWFCESIEDVDILSGTNTFISLSESLSFEQIESVAYKTNTVYYITSESFAFGNLSDNAKVIELIIEDSVLSLQGGSDQYQNMVYPNPVQHTLEIKDDHVNTVEIFDEKGTFLYRGRGSRIDMSPYAHGVYTVKLILNNGSLLIKKIIHN